MSVCVTVCLKGGPGVRSRDSACAKKTRKFNATTIASCRNSGHLHTCLSTTSKKSTPLDVAANMLRDEGSYGH